MRPRPAQPESGYGTAGEWNAYVEAGADAEQRAARLAEAPEHLRASIEAHLAMPDAIAENHRAIERRRSWRDYVMRGRGREGRRHRLGEVPAADREPVKRMVERAFEKRRRRQRRAA